MDDWLERRLRQEKHGVNRETTLAADLAFLALCWVVTVAVVLLDAVVLGRLREARR